MCLYNSITVIAFFITALLFFNDFMTFLLIYGCINMIITLLCFCMVVTLHVLHYELYISAFLYHDCNILCATLRVFIFLRFLMIVSISVLLQILLLYHCNPCVFLYNCVTLLLLYHCNTCVFLYDYNITSS